MVSEANRLIADRFAPMQELTPRYGMPKKEKVKWFLFGLCSAVVALALICFII